MNKDVDFPCGYGEALEALKVEIQSARTRTVLAVNAEVTTLYWRIGKEILVR
jgi:hypothetical protein